MNLPMGFLSPALGAVVVGVDPGMSGAVVRLEHCTLEARRDFESYREIAEAVTSLSPGSEAVVVEAVHAMPGEGVCSVWKFAEATGTATGAAYGAQRNVVRVSPQKWQNFFRKWLDLPAKVPFKSLTREVATVLFPENRDLFKRKKDHNTADAALIAVWRALTWSGVPA